MKIQHARYSLLLLLLIFGSAYSADDPRFSYEYNRCDEQAISNNDYYQCAEEEHVRQDKRLNDIYRKVMSKLPNADRILLRDAQRQWIKYRDSDFALYNHFSSGTDMQIFAIVRFVAQTAQRADELEILYNRMGYTD